MSSATPSATPADSPAQSAALLVLTGTALLSVKGVVAKLAYGAGVSVDGLLLLRFGFAVPLFWLMVRLFAPAALRGVGLADLRGCMLPAVLFAIATLADFSALTTLDVATSRLILFTYPAIILLITAVQERRMPHPATFAALAVVYLGIVMVLNPAGMAHHGAFPWAGVGWAFTSALSYAVYMVVSRPVMQRQGTARFTVLSNLLVLGLLLPFTLPGAGLGGLSAPGIGWGAVIAAGCTVVPFFLLNEGIRRWGARRASALAMTGPAMSVAAAWAILGETMGPLQLLGALVVVLGVVGLEWGVPRLGRK